MVYKLSFTAGAIIRNTVKREIESFCFKHDVDCDIRESKGFFDSEFFVTLSGDGAVINSVVSYLKKLNTET